jgi:signal transduction histidine kinase
MSKKYQILPNEIKKLQEEAVRRATESVGGPVGLYEEWPDEKPTLIVTEDTGKHGLAFCRAIWEINDGKTRCILDHQYRAHMLSQEATPQPFSECWLGVHNAFCRLKEDTSTITLLGGAFHFRKLRKQAIKRLKDYIRLMSIEQQEKLVALWKDIPSFDESYILNVITKQLELVGLWYSFMITELSRFRYEEDQVSHDLLIFLQSLIGNVEVLAIELKRSQIIGKKWDARFEEILKQCEAYSEILGTRLGNLGAPEFSYYPLRNIVYDSVDLHKAKAGKRWIELVVELEKVIDDKGQAHLPEIRMAKDYLSRAFHNILDNAIKYSYSGAAERSREVIIVGKFQNRKNVLGYGIKVSNYGIGIEHDELEKVFESGYQGKLRVGEMRPGFGVGLAFVKECIELHGGTISIESQKLSDGHAWKTTLTIWLPLYGPPSHLK